jgi:hypothetical protein
MPSQEKLTIESIEVRAVSVPLRRPIAAKYGDCLLLTFGGYHMNVQ